MCDDCEACRISPAWPRHNPLCTWCGARLISRIQRYPILADTKRDRCRTVLADWMAYGHAEQDLRRLARERQPLAPIGQGESTASERPGQRKRR